MRGKEMTPVLTAEPTEWVVRCFQDGKFCGYVRVIPGPSTTRWFSGDFGGRGRMKIGQCDYCERTYRVVKG